MSARHPAVRFLVRACLVAISAVPGLTLAAETPSPDFNAPSRTGRDIYERFRSGLAEPACPAQASAYTRQFAHAPQRLANRDDRTLALFGHVVDSLRAAHLPTEYALIPFVESGYKPTARSPAGPAGMWQMIGTTARNHKVPMRPGYDGRMSPIDSTKAAVRYLKTLHGMFGGNWRLAVMAYNAGEYRVFGAIRRAGLTPRSAKAEALVGLPDITRVYDDKLHAISCVLARADGQPRWLASLDRPVPRLAPVASSGQMVAVAQTDRPPVSTGTPQASTPVLASLLPDVAAPSSAAASLGADAMTAPDGGQIEEAAFINTASLPSNPAAAVVETLSPRRHTVAAGESLWRIAKRYQVPITDLLERNGFDTGRLLAPGMVLAIDAVAAK